MECERCSQRATFRVTRAIPGAVVAHRRLCQIHAIEDNAQPPDRPQGQPGNTDGTVEVYVSKVVVQEEHEQHFLFLRELGTTRELPVCMGMDEVQVIEQCLLNIAKARPSIHHVVAGVMAVLGGVLREVLIHSIENHTYLSVLRIERGGAVQEVDTRPSDAVAMALMLEKPILVRESILDFAASAVGCRFALLRQGRVPVGPAGPATLNGHEIGRPSRPYDSKIKALPCST